MGLIQSIIGTQAFQLIRDRITNILIAEFETQYLMTYDNFYTNINIVTEAINPFDKTELPTINVNFASGDYSAKDYGSGVRAEYQFNIDCYANAKTTPSNNGDYLSAALLQRVLGVCRYILENPIYKTLGFITPQIENVICTNVVISDRGKNDAENTIMARLILQVTCIEKNDLITPVNIASWQTTVNLNGTNEGYFWEGN